MKIERVPKDSTSFFTGNVDAADDRGNQHDGDHTDNHAEYGQERTQLIGQQRRKRHPQIFVNVTAQ